MLHLMSPQYIGEIKHPSGVAVVGNPVCGDLKQIQIKVEDGILTDVKFKTFGCGDAIATSSMVTDLAIEKTIEEALKITRNDVAENLEGLPPVKMHCSNFATEALHAAIEDYTK
jgi:nitrogen fixation NifU-like protein